MVHPLVDVLVVLIPVAETRLVVAFPEMEMVLLSGVGVLVVACPWMETMLVALSTVVEV